MNVDDSDLRGDSSSGDSLERLSAAAAAGDAAALAQLLERYLPGLRAFVRLRTGEALRQHESCTDLVQSVCREILTHAERFRHPEERAFKRWLFATALRKIATRAEYWRREKRDGRLAVELDPDGVGDARVLQEYRRFASPSEGAALRDEMARVEAAFDLLTEEQREVVTLAHLVGLTRAEIGLELGMSEGAVRTTLHRALARLSAALT